MSCIFFFIHNATFQMVLSLLYNFSVLLLLLFVFVKNLNWCIYEIKTFYKFVHCLMYIMCVCIFCIIGVTNVQKIQKIQIEKNNFVIIVYFFLITFLCAEQLHFIFKTFLFYLIFYSDELDHKQIIPKNKLEKRPPKSSFPQMNDLF